MTLYIHYQNKPHTNTWLVTLKLAKEGSSTSLYKETLDTSDFWQSSLFHLNDVEDKMGFTPSDLFGKTINGCKFKKLLTLLGFEYNGTNQCRINLYDYSKRQKVVIGTEMIMVDRLLANIAHGIKLQVSRTICMDRKYYSLMSRDMGNPEYKETALYSHFWNEAKL